MGDFQSEVDAQTRALGEANHKKARQVVERHVDMAVELLLAADSQGVDLEPVFKEISGPSLVMMLERLQGKELSKRSTAFIQKLLLQKKKDAEKVVEGNIDTTVEFIKNLVSDGNDDVVSQVIQCLQGPVGPDLKRRLIESDIPQSAKDQIKASLV